MSQMFSEYQLVEQLAKKTGSSLYLAQSLASPNDKVVIKAFDTVQFGNRQDLESFQQEVIFLKQLQHPNILPILNYGIERGHPYLISAYMPQKSLRDRLTSSSLPSLSLQEALEIINQIGLALVYAHDWNILHSALKTENVLSGEHAEVLLTDFTVPCILECHVPRYRPSIRSACYMAPEQFTGTTSRESDQYALGCLAYELLTGRSPFTASALSTWRTRHTSERPTPLTEVLPSIPAHIEAAVLKALAKGSHERHESVAAFIEAMQISSIRQEQVSLNAPDEEIEVTNDTNDIILIASPTDKLPAITLKLEILPIPFELPSAEEPSSTIELEPPAPLSPSSETRKLPAEALVTNEMQMAPLIADEDLPIAPASFIAPQILPLDHNHPSLYTQPTSPSNGRWRNNAVVRRLPGGNRGNAWRVVLLALTIVSIIILSFIAIPLLFQLPQEPARINNLHPSVNSQPRGTAEPRATTTDMRAQQSTPTASGILPEQKGTPTAVPTYSLLPASSGLTPTPHATQTSGSTTLPRSTPTHHPELHPTLTSTHTPTPTPTSILPTPTQILPAPTPSQPSTHGTPQNSNWLRRLSGW